MENDPGDQVSGRLFYDEDLREILEMPVFDRESARRTVNSKLGAPVIRPATRQLHIPVVRYAAVLLILLLAGAAYYFHIDQITYTNTGDAGYAIVLPDHSEVILGAKSSLRYNRNFNRTHRKVHLEGDAFFNVQFASQRMFSVVTNGYELQVVGTEFLVEQNEGICDVRLLEGKVLFRNDQGDSRNLTEGQALRAKNGTIEQVLSLSGQKDPGWMPESLFFDNIPLGEAIGQINALYGREVVRINDPANASGCLIYSRFSPGQLDEFLEELQMIFKIKLRDYKGSFAIDEINCNS
jgi:ferric-dicitrate binding protein FerR (iron transport regulator)